MVGWHHQLNGSEFEQILGDSEGQGSLVYCHSQSHKGSDMTEQLNNNSFITSPSPKTCSYGICDLPFIASSHLQFHNYSCGIRLVNSPLHTIVNIPKAVINYSSVPIGCLTFVRLPRHGSSRDFLNKYIWSIELSFVFSFLDSTTHKI